MDTKITKEEKAQFAFIPTVLIGGKPVQLKAEMIYH
jgi:hypothetical protein